MTTISEALRELEEGEQSAMRLHAALASLEQPND